MVSRQFCAQTRARMSERGACRARFVGKHPARDSKGPTPTRHVSRNLLLFGLRVGAAERQAVSRQKAPTMSKIEEYFSKYQEDGDIAWPKSPEERDRLASDLLGAEIASSLDGWVDRADDLVRNRVSLVDFPRKNQAWKRDVRTREALAGLRPEQQAAVLSLVAETASGVLFSTLVAFDQCVGAEIRVAAHDRETSEKLASILPGYDDFHDRLYEWIDIFSEHPARYDPDTSGG